MVWLSLPRGFPVMGTVLPTIPSLHHRPMVIDGQRTSRLAGHCSMQREGRPPTSRIGIGSRAGLPERERACRTSLRVVNPEQHLRARRCGFSLMRANE